MRSMVEGLTVLRRKAPSNIWRVGRCGISGTVAGV
jgi:hypothetical protein